MPSSSSLSSLAMYSSVSISISDDDEEDNFVRKARQQFRRKRKGVRHRQKKNEILLRAVRALRRWWTIFLFLPAISLLVFEAVKILGKPHQPVESERGSVKNMSGNLNRIVPTTHIVNVARKSCLKLLPLEELQNLDILPVESPSSPIQKIIYMLESDGSYAGGNTTLLRQHMGVMRFNLFTGYQTLQEREESYKVNETAVMHCGFYSENGGFQVSGEDKSYMQMCKVVVSTCAFGGGDDLYQPIGMTEASLRKVCYVAFWDEVTLQTQELEGRRIDEDHMIGKWRIIVVRQLPFVDQRLNGKIPKMLGHRLFP